MGRMQYDEAVQLQKQWGDKPCSHPYGREEYYRKNKTDNLVCAQCGRDIPEEDRGRIEKSLESVDDCLNWLKPQETH
jgi:hypothetical protein